MRCASSVGLRRRAVTYVLRPPCTSSYRGTRPMTSMPRVTSGCIHTLAKFPSSLYVCAAQVAYPCRYQATFLRVGADMCHGPTSSSLTPHGHPQWAVQINQEPQPKSLKGESSMYMANSRLSILISLGCGVTMGRVMCPISEHTARARVARSTLLHSGTP